MRRKVFLTSIYISFCLFYLIGGSWATFAQVVKMGDKEYIQRIWRTEEGLPQNTVTSIVQTHDGYLWLGTFGGLARFDGIKFTLFTSSNTPELKSNRIINLIEDREGALWIISEQGTLARYAEGRFTDYTSWEGMPIGDMGYVLPDSKGNLWVCTQHGLFQFQERRLVRQYTTEDGLPSNFIHKILEDRDSNLWVCTQRGLVRISDERLTAYTAQNGLPYPDVTNVVESRNDGLLVICSDSLFSGSKEVRLSAVSRYQNGAFSTIIGAFNNITATTDSLYEDTDGTLWIAGFDSGLHQWKEGRQSSFTMKEGLENSYIRGVMRDREGNLWFCPTGGGLARWREKKLMTYSKAEGLFQDDVSSIIEDKAGIIWIGNFYLSRFQQGRLETPQELAAGAKTGMNDGFARPLFVDGDGSLWFSHSIIGGAELTRLKDGVRANWQTLGWTNTIYRDRVGRMWLGWNGGLCQFVDGKFINYDEKQGLVAGFVVFIHEDRDGALWLGSTGGLSRFKDGQFTNYTTGQGLSHNFVRAIHEDADGTFWLGTYGGGLNRFRNGRFIAITAKDGLMEDIVSRILVDDDDNFWISGNRGIYRISHQELDDFADGKIRSVNPVSYGVADGMLSSETNGGAQPAGWRTRDGRLWFPTIKGVVVINPRERNALAPPVMIEQVAFDKMPLDLQGNLEASPGDGDLEIQYTGLSFQAPEKVRFKYKLEGYDNDWIDAGTRRVAYYTKIPPGPYTFHVRAANNDGVWNDAGATIRFRLKPHFYQTWFFYGLCGLAFLGLGFIVLRFRLRQLQERLEQEQQIAERLRQVDKMKDEFLANTSHELRTPLNGIIGLAESLIAGVTGKLPQSAIANLSMIASSGQRLAHLVNDILDFAKLRHHELQLQLRPVDLRSLADVVLTLTRPLADGRSLRLFNDIAPDLPLAQGDENRLQQILYNLVGNAIKFTPTGSVTISARQADEFITVAVTDTGIGIAKDKQAVIFESFEQVDASATREFGGTGLGLALTRQLVELHGGTITVESTIGKGSQFTFTLPVSAEARQSLSLAASASPSVNTLLPVNESDKQPVKDDGQMIAHNRQSTASILVVDDEPVNIQVLNNHLALEQYRVITASNGQDALRLLQDAELQPDLVLLDVMMPGVSGYEVCERIRRNYSADELPVIILTARTQVADLVIGLTSGANDFLSKPISRDELLSRIRTHLALLEKNRALREARDTLEIKVQQRTEELHASNTQLQNANEQMSELNDQLADVNRQLGLANENMLAVLNQLKVGVIMTDHDGKVTFLSQTAESLFDHSHSDVTGFEWENLLPIAPEDKEKLQAMGTLPEKDRNRVPVNFQSVNGRRYWMEVEVQDDPRDKQKRIFFLYDVSETYDLRRLLDDKARFHDMVGESIAMQLIFKQIEDVALMDTTVLVEGETGTGKELVARAIHYSSPRRNRPFIAINCAGLTESLVTSQLFGHKRGAFTGAVADQIGVFEAASQGTVFLDEIGDIPLTVQTNLLRVLQEREITRIGEAKPRRVDVRVIAATHRDLQQEVASGRFRQDLLYRIRVAHLHLPALRNRRGDIPLLVSWFLGQLRTESGKPVQDVSREAMQKLISYDWHGNVRELKSAMEWAVIRCKGLVIQPEDLPSEVYDTVVIREKPLEPKQDKREYLLEALKRAGGNRAATARQLGIGRSTLYRWLEELDIE